MPEAGAGPFGATHALCGPASRAAEDTKLWAPAGGKGHRKEMLPPGCIVLVRPQRSMLGLYESLYASFGRRTLQQAPVGIAVRGNTMPSRSSVLTAPVVAPTGIRNIADVHLIDRGPIQMRWREHREVARRSGRCPTQKTSSRRHTPGSTNALEKNHLKRGGDERVHRWANDARKAEEAAVAILAPTCWFEKPESNRRTTRCAAR